MKHMNRKIFLTSILAATIISMDGFSSIVNAISNDDQEGNSSSEFATYGAIHLNNTSLVKSTHFWTEIAGMKQRKVSGKSAEFGTDTETLVVVHETAKTAYAKGYSGLYHFAIHAPNAAAFASMVHRLNVNKYPYSPVDHTMSKSVYLDDPDGINVEFTLETPERFKRVITTGGLKMEGADGVIRSASERLDLIEVMKALEERGKIIAEGSYLGHVHLYANNVDSSNAFYKQLGYVPANYLPQFMFADLGAGGDYTHRIVMNSWHGQNRPLAPAGSAGLRHFQIDFKDETKLKEALGNVSKSDENEDGYWLNDPTGNRILLTKKA